MGMSNFTRFFRAHKNKIFALTFVGLGLAVFLAFYLVMGFSTEWAVFRTSIAALLNFLITLFCYGYLLFTNIYNDNRAYSAIFTFVGLMVIQAVFNIIDISIAAGSALWNGQVLNLTLFLGYATLSGGVVGIGIPFYIFTFRYLFGRDNRFSKVRLFALLFLGILALSVIFYLTYEFVAGLAVDVGTTLWILALPISELLVGAGVVFTLERLRRI